MTKRELVDILNDYDDNMEVLVAKDEEWNSLRLAYSVDAALTVRDDGEYLEDHEDDRSRERLVIW